MDRPSSITKFILTIGIFLLTIVVSCGPRSGTHNDNEDSNNSEKINPQASEKVIDVWYNEEDGKLFKQNCAVCHSLNDQIIDGPGFANVGDRLPQPAENWFIKYTLNSEKVFNSGDPYAAKLKNEYKGKVMPAFEDILTEEEINRIYKVVTFSTSRTVH